MYNVGRTRNEIVLRQTILLLGAIGLFLSILIAAPIARAEQWREPWKKNHCTGNGTRQYSSQLMDIPFGKSWEQACAGMSATINGRTFAAPSRCVNNAGMWGEFDQVPDPDCGAKWGDFSSNACSGGTRTYWARLWNIVGDWDAACRMTPATVGGTRFARPTRCINKGVAGMFGEFDVSDASCNAFWGPIEAGSCVAVGQRKYTSTIMRARNWIADCRQTPLTVAGVSFATPTECRNCPTHAWGEFIVSDPKCTPRFGAPVRQGCDANNKLRFTASFLDVPEGENAHKLCTSGSWKADIPGHGALAPSECQPTDAFGTGYNGLFVVDDPSCAPKRNEEPGAPKASSCDGLSKLKYTSGFRSDVGVWVFDDTVAAVFGPMHALTNNGHVKPGQSTELKLDQTGHNYYVIAIDLAEVTKHNEAFPRNKVDPESADPQLGAVYASQYYAAATIGPVKGCASGGTEAVTHAPAPQREENRSGWKTPTRGRRSVR
jgi:hypothetical protein